jgi:exosortase D (VPLPA-CTERM-specific)
MSVRRSFYMLKSNPLLHKKWLQLAVAAGIILTFGMVFQKTFVYLYVNWHREEYSHGFLIPLICLLLLWQRRRVFLQSSLHGSWSGVAVVLLGLLLAFLGFAASIVGVDAYALVVVIVGCVVAAVGWRGLRLAALPVALLLLMVPLPTFWYNNLSSQLQLLSSQIGVDIIRALGVSVFLEGNVIDLGSYKLQVAEACSGLRYLFPLMTLGAVIAYLFKGRMWSRWCLFLSTLPIAVLMNSVRIGIIGLLVDRFGSEQAEGFLHQFEGWIIFMVCLGLLLLECVLLLRLQGDRRTLREALQWDLPSARLKPGSLRTRLQLGWPAVSAALVMMFAVYPAWALPQRLEARPSRSDFSQFPLSLGNWVGRRTSMEGLYLDELKLDDYLLADFVPSKGGADAVSSNVPVNVYVAYYSSQRSGQAVHSPRSCLPGGGWRIEQVEQREVDGVRLRGGPLRVNRVLIRKGSDRQLVYYWFQERGRDLTNEYLVKWYLVADALTENRSDGALVRIITPLKDGDDPRVGDARLSRFSESMAPLLDKFVGG